MQLLVFQFIRSLLQADFQQYVQALGKLVPWLFAMGHTNYARWLPVHIRDMVLLETQHPDSHEEFMNGHFVVQKTANVFSTIGMDQAHEQLNDQIKGDGGAIGLTAGSRLRNCTSCMKLRDKLLVAHSTQETIAIMSRI